MLADCGHIVVVDDDPSLRKMVTRYLEDHNMPTKSASNRTELNRHFAETPPSLIILGSAHRCPGLATAAQAGGRSECTARHSDRARRRLCLRTCGRTVLKSDENMTPRTAAASAIMAARGCDRNDIAHRGDDPVTETPPNSFRKQLVGAIICWRSIHLDRKTNLSGGTMFRATIAALQITTRRRRAGLPWQTRSRFQP
jgi:hypothetical protein